MVRFSRWGSRGGVLERSGSDPTHILFGEIPKAHASYVGVGVGLTRALVFDDLEEVVKPTGNVPLFGWLLDPGRVSDLAGLFEPQLRREAHGPRYRPELVKSGVSDLALAQHADVGKGHDTAGRVLHLLPDPLDTIPPEIPVPEQLELLRDSQSQEPPFVAVPGLPPFWLRTYEPCS